MILSPLVDESLVELLNLEFWFDLIFLVSYFQIESSYKLRWIWDADKQWRNREHCQNCKWYWFLGNFGCLLLVQRKFWFFFLLSVSFLKFKNEHFSCKKTTLAIIRVLTNYNLLNVMWWWICCTTFKRNLIWVNGRSVIWSLVFLGLVEMTTMIWMLHKWNSSLERESF